jgi:hypothetical protein
MTYRYRVEAAAAGSEAVLRFEQTGEIFDLPVTVILEYADGRTTRVVVPIWDRDTEMRVALEGTLRSIDISKDDGTLAEITRQR